MRPAAALRALLASGRVRESAPVLAERFRVSKRHVFRLYLDVRATHGDRYREELRWDGRTALPPERWLEDGPCHGGVTDPAADPDLTTSDPTGSAIPPAPVVDRRNAAPAPSSADHPLAKAAISSSARLASYRARARERAREAAVSAKEDRRKPWPWRPAHIPAEVMDAVAKRHGEHARRIVYAELSKKTACENHLAAREAVELLAQRNAHDVARVFWRLFHGAHTLWSEAIELAKVPIPPRNEDPDPHKQRWVAWQEAPEWDPESDPLPDVETLTLDADDRALFAQLERRAAELDGPDPPARGPPH